MKAQVKTNSRNRKRIVWLMFFIFIVQTAIISRYAYVQIVMGPKLQQWAKDQWTNDTKIAARRGKILDRNGNPLAVSGNVERVDVFLKDLKSAVKNKKKNITEDEVAGKLASVLDLKKSDILAKFNKKLKDGRSVSSAVIARRIEREIGNKIREMKLPGIVITEDTKRYYPNGNFLSQVLGNTDIDGNGRAGIELKYNELLKGSPGRFMGETDRYHRELPYSISSYVAPKNGSDLELTIDQSIQYFVEKVCEKGMVDYKAKRVSCIVMDPRSGEILAMANKPDYNPNKPIVGDVKEAMNTWKNSTVNDVFEPGSILKLVTASAAIEEKLVSDNDKFMCRGSYKVGDRTIHCWKRTGHGEQTFSQIVENSCNVGFMMLGEKLQKNKVYKYFNLFGLGKKTNVDLPGEEKGIIKNIDKVGKVELANEVFGQGISVTMIQYMAALSAIANDGKMVEPHILKRILNTDEDGNTSVTKESGTKEVKQVISIQTARKLRGIMENVVVKGGAKKAFIAGYHIGGKTGTAQKVVNGSYGFAKYISSFAGIAPASNPQIAVLLSIDEPDPSTPAGYYSGQTAAPLGKILLTDIFRYKNMLPDQNDPALLAAKDIQVPEIRGTQLEAAKKLLQSKTLGYEVQGNGNLVYDISPKPGVMVRKDTKITIYLGVEKNASPRVSVPDFKDLSEYEIKETAAQLGIKISINGEGVGSTQDILPGTLIDKNRAVTILLEAPEE